MKIRKLGGVLLGTLMLAACGQQTGAPGAPLPPSVTAPVTSPDASPNDLADAGEGPEVVVPDPGYLEQDFTAQGLKAWPLVKQGSGGQDVRTLQYLLNAHGSSLAVDGDFGPGTDAAVRRFQSAQGLQRDGVVGPDTWAKLIVTVQQGSRGNAVKALQDILGVAVDGDFGPGTDSAVRGFQSSHGLQRDGVVGPKTWQALIAGTSGSGGGGGGGTGGSTRSAIVARGKVWVDAHVPYSMSGYHDGWRTDCSGFISMAWNLRTSQGGKISANTSSLWNYAVHFTDVNDLQPGDAIDSSTASGATGGANHVVLFVKWLNKSNHTFLTYQEKGRAYGTVQSTAQLVRVSGGWKLANSSRPHWYFLRSKTVR